MKRIFLYIILSVFASGLYAQRTTSSEVIQQSIIDAKEKLEDWNTEHMIDSLDQEKLPHLVSGGVMAGVNMSNFIITSNHIPMSSYMRLGGELGGFLDFRMSKHFSIQPQVIFTAHQNYFAASDTTNRLWSFGAEIPIYFLGRFGNMEKGYVQFGAGIYTHFTFASNIKNKFKNLDESTTLAVSDAPTRYAADTHDYSRLYDLHSNHFGVCATVGYELPFGMQINLHYKISLSDIAGFYSEMKGKEVAKDLIYPQSISLSLAYRWR